MKKELATSKAVIIGGFKSTKQQQERTNLEKLGTEKRSC
jgi:hypothetical protein